MVLQLPDFLVELKFENVGFWGEGKTGVRGKNLSEQRREPKTNSTNIWHWCQDLKVGHIGGRRVLSPLLHPCNSIYVISLGKVLNYVWTLKKHKSVISVILPAMRSEHFGETCGSRRPIFANCARSGKHFNRYKKMSIK